MGDDHSEIPTEMRYAIEYMADPRTRIWGFVAVGPDNMSFSSGAMMGAPDEQLARMAGAMLVDVATAADAPAPEIVEQAVEEYNHLKDGVKYE